MNIGQVGGSAAVQQAAEMFKVLAAAQTEMVDLAEKIVKVGVQQQVSGLGENVDVTA